MKTRLITALSLPLCLLTFNTQAKPPEPQVCPRASDIRAIGVSHNMVEEGHHLWFTGRRDQKYGTTSNWTFLMGKIPATSVNDAYGKAVVALTTLQFSGGPVIGPLDKWVCYYRNDKGYPAIAVNPPIARFNEQHFIN